MNENLQLFIASICVALVVSVITYILIRKQNKFASTIKKGDTVKYTDLDAEVVEVHDDGVHVTIKTRVPKMRLNRKK